MLQWELQRCGCCTCSVVTCNITTYGSKCAHLCTNTHTHTHTHTPHTPQRGGQSQQVCQRQTPQLLRAVQPLLGPTCWSKMEWCGVWQKFQTFVPTIFRHWARGPSLFVGEKKEVVGGTGEMASLAPTTGGASRSAASSGPVSVFTDFSHPRCAPLSPFVSSCPEKVVCVIECQVKIDRGVQRSVCGQLKGC
jgi:hypothetical protein